MKFSSMTILLVLFTVVSCGKLGQVIEKSPNKAYEVEEEFRSYVESFEAVSAQYGRPIKISNLIVRMSDDSIGSRVMGNCTVYSNDSKPPRILINKNYWDRISDAAREELIFHEIGHCILKRGHRDSFQTIYGLQIPLSVMNPYHFNGTWYEANHHHYMTELLFRVDLASYNSPLKLANTYASEIGPIELEANEDESVSHDQEEDSKTFNCTH